MSIKNIGIMTSGGDSSGMNPAIRALVRTGIYHGCTIQGIHYGYEGLIEDDIEELDLSSVSGIINRGGTVLQTARSERFCTPEGRRQAYETLKRHGIDCLIVIGGDGSLKGLHTFCNEHQDIQGIGLPGTIDNDMYGSDYTIGFDTAINVALDAIDRIRDTANSHHRLFLVEVMGRYSGHIALYSGISGGAEDILIPETPTDIPKLIDRLHKGKERGKKSSIVIVAEGDEAGNAFQIRDMLQDHTTWPIRVSILGHMQRGGAPTANDRILASRLGYHAILAALKEKNQIMVGIINDRVAFTPLPETWEKKKEIRQDELTMADILST